MREWHVVFVAGFALGYFSRWLFSKIRRVVRWPWFALVLVYVQACAPLRTAVEVAGGVTLGVGEVRRATSQPAEGSVQAEQRAARARANAALEKARREGMLR